ASLYHGPDQPPTKEFVFVAPWVRQDDHFHSPYVLRGEVLRSAEPWAMICPVGARVFRTC
ncbi:MAG TPA: hypothetical protein PKA58_10465, partial [Polyangium sp.]|nr:hypothetical protein [Polyangium sp.]